MISSMRMTSESSNLLLLVDDAIQSSIECSNFYDSLSTVKDNALNHALVLEKQLEVLSERLKIAELEASITIAQLHQVQEKLEYYLLLSQQQAQMLEKSANLQERTAVLLANSNR
jgi:Lon protease-like protein